MTDTTIVAGHVVYARRVGNRTHAWYVIDEVTGQDAFGLYCYAHREHGAGGRQRMTLRDVRRVEVGSVRWNGQVA